MESQIIMIVIFGAVMIIMGLLALLTRKKPIEQGKDSIASAGNEKQKNKQGAVERNSKHVVQRDMNEFIKFDKIANDMIYQNDGERYTMAIQCKGINYYLMSEIEQMSIEEGFIMFLNTLKFPIQIYVQTKSIDLSKNIKGYHEKVEGFLEKQNEATARYVEVEDDVDATQDQVDYLKREKIKYTNIAEYAYDITKYVERLALNKYMLQREFYILISYNKAELATTEKFTDEEYEDLCYRELYTRAQAIISSLLSCSVTGRVLTSNELAQLVYTALNKDDASIMPINDVLESGLFRLYTTSDDIFKKRRDMLEKEFEEQGKRRVEEAVRQAIEKGYIVTQAENEESIQKEIDKRALRMIERSSVDENTKQVLKSTVRENRRKRVEELNELIKSNKVIEDQAKQAKTQNSKVDKEEDELIIDIDTTIQDDEIIIDTKEGDDGDEK